VQLQKTGPGENVKPGERPRRNNADKQPVSAFTGRLRREFEHSEINLPAVVANAHECVCDSADSHPCRPSCPVNADVCSIMHQLKKAGLLANTSFNKLGFKSSDELLRAVDQNAQSLDPNFMEQLDLLLYAAHKIIKRANPIYVATSSVCPSELLCESGCKVNILKGKEHVNIGRAVSFIAGWMVNNNKRMVAYRWYEDDEVLAEKNSSIAVIGSGPSGLTAAYLLAQKGFNVTVYDSHSEAGGILMNDIPMFRLPKKRIKFTIDRLKNMGINFITDTTVRNIAKDIESGKWNVEGTLFDAYILSIGKTTPCLPGNRTGFENIFFDTEFLKETGHFVNNHLRMPSLVENIIGMVSGRNAVVIGGGNSALDVARTLHRLGAGKVFVVTNDVIKKETKYDKPPTMLEREAEAARKEGVTIVYGAVFIELCRSKGNKDMVSGVKYRKDGKTTQISAALVVYAIGRKMGELHNLGANTNDYNQIINHRELKGAPFAAGDCTTKFVNEKEPYKIDFDHPHHYHNVISAVSSGREVALDLEKAIAEGKQPAGIL